MKKVFIQISEEVHAQLKSMAALERTTLKGLIESVLDEHVKNGGEKKK